MKAKRKRIVKPIISVKPTNPVIQDKQIKANEVELISVPVSADAITTCDGCYFYDEPNSKCNDKEGLDCTGIIFVEK